MRSTACLLLLAACEAVPVDSGVYYSGSTGGAPSDSPSPDDTSACPEDLPEGTRYSGAVSVTLDREPMCDGDAALIWTADDAVAFHAFCSGPISACLSAEGTVSGGAISAALTTDVVDGPTRGPHDISGTIDSSGAALSWSFTDEDREGGLLEFVGEATLSP